MWGRQTWAETMGERHRKTNKGTSHGRQERDWGGRQKWKDTERQNEKLRLTWRERERHFYPDNKETNKQTNSPPERWEEEAGLSR